MLRSLTRKLLVLAIAVGALSLVAAPVSLAAPDLAASISISPSTVSARQSITVTQSVTNNSPSQQTVTLTDTLVDPRGRTYVTTPPGSPASIAAGATFTQQQSYTIDPSYPRGTYTLTFSATDQSGTATAMTTYTIVK